MTNRVALQKQLAHFEGLYNQLKPKSRYISEIIIEDENDQLEKELLNGDTAVSKAKANVRQSPLS